MEFNNLDNISDWKKWKETLSKSVDLGESIGLSDETISKLGVKLGNFLSASVDPENKEERVLQELWRVSDGEDKKVLSKLIMKMVQTDER